MIFQSEANECGLACLANASCLMGRPITLNDLRQRFPSSLRGSNLQQLIRIAGELGFATRPVRLELEQLSKLETPCILHWDLNHFVVLRKVGRRGAVILDPAVGERRLQLSEVSKHFTGFALELDRTEGFQAIKPGKRTSLRALMGRVRGLKRSVAHMLLLSGLLELFTVVTPLLSQLVVDDAISSHDESLLTATVLAFALFLTTQVTLSVARSWLLLVLGQSWALQWSTGLLQHTLRLPVAFFEKRHLGDIISRIGSADAIQKTLTSSVVEALIDGFMGMLALIFMLVYSPMLSAIVLIAIALYAVLRYFAYRPYRDAAAERLVMSARERTHFLESMRAIVPLKLFGREEQRLSQWRNLFVDVQNRDASTQKMSIAFSASNAMLFGLENLTIFWLGAKMVMQTGTTGGAFTVGMLFAFISFKTQLTDRFNKLVDYAIDLKMLNLHSERLSDIATSEPEPADHTTRDCTELDATIELRNVSFRYGSHEPWILKEVSAKFGEGESVAIVGPSGSGKTTLLKIILGLLSPTEGEVLYGGLPLSQIGMKSYRAIVGTVMQDDLLLAGTIFQNISFFDEEWNESVVADCAKLALIHDDIVRMPMGYQTLVGDMGSSLSGGQKQRVLLARALYKRPRVLALDEATSHLDVSNEKLIIQTLARMNIMRISVAHRPETIAGANRVIRLQESRLVELRPVDVARELQDSRSLN